MATRNDAGAASVAPPAPPEDDCLNMVATLLGELPKRPRGYQAQAFVRVFEEFEQGRPSTLVVMPTGLGKTVTFLLIAANVIRNMGGRVLVIAHRGELIQQASNSAAEMGLTPAIEQADSHARPDLTLGSPATGTLHFGDDSEPDEFDGMAVDGDPKLVVASVQTLQGKRLERWPRGHFDLVIVDEAHHATADSYQRVIRHFAPRMLLGVTATADRADGTPLAGTGQTFESLAYEYFLAEAVHLGFLAPPRFAMIPTTVDLSKIRTTGGDLNAGDLEELLKPHIAELVNESAPKLAGRKFIVFTPDVGSADLVASAFCSLGLSCMSVSGQSADRASVLAEFRDGRYQGVANCALLTEGYDNPAVDAVLVMRPTKSRSLFVQMVGRGLRLFHGKEDCRVLLYSWQQGKHKLIRPVDLFHATSKGPVDEEFKDAAQKKIESGEEADLLLAMKKAAKETKAHRERLRIEVEQRAARLRSYEYDPLGFDPEAEHRPMEYTSSWEAQATPNQVAALLRAGFAPDFVGGLSKKRASGIMADLVRRREAGLSSHKQAELLKRLGFKDGRKLSFDQASALITELKGKRGCA